MPQQQHLVRLILRDGQQRQAIATGNNAAWVCECGRVLPLIGRSGTRAGASEGTRVDCPDCGRHYFVAPADKDRGAVLEVREIG